MKALMATKEALEKSSDTALGSSKGGSALTAHGKEDEAIAFYKERGLKVEKVPFYEYSTEIGSLKNVSLEQAEAIKAGLNKVMAWVATLDEDFVEKEDVADNGSQAQTSVTLEGNVLKANLVGRVDSINAPELIEKFNELSKDTEIAYAAIDMKKLEYISSAGLRFLLMMKKNVADKKVIVKNVNEVVKEILETTGFDDMLDFE